MRTLIIHFRVVKKAEVPFSAQNMKRKAVMPVKICVILCTAHIVG